MHSVPFLRGDPKPVIHHHPILVVLRRAVEILLRQQPEPPSTTMKTNTIDVPLSLSKTVNQLRLLEQSYSIALWRSDEHRNDWVHDVALMAHHKDLKGLTARLLDRVGQITLELPFQFRGEQERMTRIDSAKGLEIPLLRPDTVVRGELIVRRNGNDEEYADDLRLSWSTAEERDSRANRRFASEHMAKITAGRVASTFEVTQDVERLLEVTQTGSHEFAFARELNGKLEGVFLHRAHVEDNDPNFRFRCGQHFSAILVQSPKGLQGRSIRPVNQAH